MVNSKEALEMSKVQIYEWFFVCDQLKRLRNFNDCKRNCSNQCVFEKRDKYNRFIMLSAL